MEYKDFKLNFEMFYKDNTFYIIPYEMFIKLPLSYTFGVYMDFFAQKHIYIQLKQIENDYYRVGLTWNEQDLLGKGIIKNSLKEAREEGFQIAKSYYSSLQNFDGFEVCEY